MVKVGLRDAVRHFVRVKRGLASQGQDLARIDVEHDRGGGEGLALGVHNFGQGLFGGFLNLGIQREGHVGALFRGFGLEPFFVIARRGLGPMFPAAVPGKHFVVGRLDSVGTFLASVAQFLQVSEFFDEFVVELTFQDIGVAHVT